MNYNFKIIVFTDDPNFSISLTQECDRYGFSLFFTDDLFGVNQEISDKTIAVMLIDLNDPSIDPFKLCSDVKKEYGIPVFGVLNNFSKKIQEKAKNAGFDLIFTKKMLLKSIKEVVIHISNE
tara:strand:+ start:3708 stop:4073 length:366 start_codon:yes stop_codon:yes gene_type:complete